MEEMLWEIDELYEELSSPRTLVEGDWPVPPKVESQYVMEFKFKLFEAKRSFLKGSDNKVFKLFTAPVTRQQKRNNESVQKKSYWNQVFKISA